MRKALWAATDNLQCKETELAISKSKEDGKLILAQLERNLPFFALFQSDRSSRDSDEEVQNPMKAAINAALAEMQVQIDAIQKMVQEKAVAIATDTHRALSAIDPGLAKELTPHFNPPTASKWTNLFSLGMNTDDGIPLNKRGSGVRRLVLVSFFKAEAERKLQHQPTRGVIYAIEEPETAQHPNNQRVLLESFKALASTRDCQVILTTHSPGFASELPTESIRYVTRANDGGPMIQAGIDVFGSVAAALGVVPDNRVKVLVCVEGPTDVEAYTCLSKALHTEDPTIPNLGADERIAFVPLGGGTLKHWVAKHYLQPLNRPEVHLYDNDVDYAAQVAMVNFRKDGSWGAQTRKHEIENYLHSDAIKSAFGVDVVVPDQVDVNGDSVPKIFAKALFAKNPVGAPLNDSNAKKKLAEKAFPKMTADMIRARDPDGEVEGWFRRIAALLNRAALPEAVV